MLRYATKMLPVVLRAGLTGRRGLVSRIRRRVQISESDFNLHMNQASYALVAEFGRADWVLRAGVLERIRAAKVHPVVGEQRLVYRRELKPGQAYEIDTRATGFDGRLLKVDGHLLVGDRVHTAVYARLLFIGPDGVLSVEDTQELLQEFVTDPLPVENWRVVDR